MFMPKGPCAGLPKNRKGNMRGYGSDIAWFKDPAGNVPSVTKG